MMTLIVNLTGILLLAFIVYWFFLATSKAKVLEGDQIDIVVADGVYQPAVISAKSNHPITLRFIRRDETPCSKYVIFDDLNVSAELPIGQPHDITLTVETPGEYEFTCQMGMYRGRLIIT